jgi:hypothetical protein
MAKGEFVNRELGDLPEDIEAERIDRVSSWRGDALADLRYQQQIKTTPKAPGTIPYSGEVISTYDSRPINGFDFSATGWVQWNITAPPPAALQLQFQYNVPGGYIAVLRGYRYEMDPAVPITYGQLLLDIFVNDIAQLGYQGLMHGQSVTSFVPCFILADDSATIRFNWRAPTGIASLVGQIRYMSIEFYGNLILATGAPLNLEVANKEIGLPVKAAEIGQGGGPVGPGLSGLGQYGNTKNAYRSLTRHRARHPVKIKG